MQLFNSDEQLRRYLPNLVQTVKGETPYLERLADFFLAAEEYVKFYFTGDEIFNKICELGVDEQRRFALARSVALHAFYNAIPTLDVVLTPNGFGIVNSSNIAPASQHRVNNLRESVLQDRDESFNNLLLQLQRVPEWLTTRQAGYFSSTLFPRLVDVGSFGSYEGSKWERYRELAPRIADKENALADKYFSRELMSALRAELLSGECNPERRKVAVDIRQQVIAIYRDSWHGASRCFDIVNYIRNDETNFPEWHASQTAKLFDPPVFRNKQDSGGYFF